MPGCRSALQAQPLHRETPDNAEHRRADRPQGCWAAADRRRRSGPAPGKPAHCAGRTRRNRLATAAGRMTTLACAHPGAKPAVGPVCRPARISPRRRAASLNLGACGAPVCAASDRAVSILSEVDRVAFIAGRSLVFPCLRNAADCRAEPGKLRFSVPGEVSIPRQSAAALPVDLRLPQSPDPWRRLY